MSRRLVSLGEIAEAAGVSIKTVRRRIVDGTLPAYRVGKVIRVDENDIDKLFRPIPAGRFRP